MKKKELLSLYVAFRKKLGPEGKPTFQKFNKILKQNDTSKYMVNKHFGSFTELKKIGQHEYEKTLTKKQQALLSERSKKFDETVSKEDCIEDLRKLQKEDWGCYITRTHYRNNGTYSDSTWSQYFGTFQEFRRQAGLELTRHQHKLETSIAKVASIDHYREFFNSEVLPYYNKYKVKERNHHIKTIMVASDIHDKECHEFTLSVFIEECRIKQPDVIVLNGDIYDLFEFGRYKIDPRHFDITGRFNFVRNRILAPLRKVCPNSQIDLIAGNHEMRLLKLMADATPNIRILLSDVMNVQFKDVFGLDDFEINWASKFDLGAYTAQDIKNETKKNYRIYYNSYAVAHIPDRRLKNFSGTNGHHHQCKFESYNHVNRDTHLTEMKSWVQTPAMHLPDAEYLSNVPGWNLGFLEVVININNGEVIQKPHVVQDEWAIIDGRYYEA